MSDELYQNVRGTYLAKISNVSVEFSIILGSIIISIHNEIRKNGEYRLSWRDEFFRIRNRCFPKSKDDITVVTDLVKSHLAECFSEYEDQYKVTITDSEIWIEYK